MKIYLAVLNQQIECDPIPTIVTTDCGAVTWTKAGDGEIIGERDGGFPLGTIVTVPNIPTADPAASANILSFGIKNDKAYISVVHFSYDGGFNGVLPVNELENLPVKIEIPE